MKMIFVACLLACCGCLASMGYDPMDGKLLITSLRIGDG